MLQFTDQEMTEIRQRATLAIINKLIEDNQVILNSDTLVPPDSRATWNLYYYCPHHGVRLQWNRHDDKQHVCPIDGEVFRGEPYDGAWWRWLNDLNSKACYELGLLWQITQQPNYLHKVKDILLSYATQYPHYEVHGDIPYNGPGKANAQTLCEANCHLNFARGYDFIRDQLSVFERQSIENRLLREGAEFLIANRSPQLHNHEIRINSAVGVIGLLLNDLRYINFAVLSDYGLHYQLNHGCIGEGMWFEGSIHYHYYALQSLLVYEKIAYKTEFSVGWNPNFLKMLKFPLALVMSNGRFPRLNDCIAGQEQVIQSEVFEFGFREYPFTELHQALEYIYRFEERHNLEALLYGEPTLRPTQALSCQPCHKPYAGYTCEYNPDQKHSLLVKHAPFGGEHDHYDRISFILCRDGKEIMPDLGTTGYGAKLHYEYYKNSATHNTLMVNETNQSPNVPQVRYYERNDTYTLIDICIDWRQPSPDVDSHIIVQWDQDAYKKIEYRRTFIWVGECVIDISSINNPHQQQLDVINLIRGKHQLSFAHCQPINNPFQKVLSVLTDCQRLPLSAHSPQSLHYHIEQQSDFHQQWVCNQDAELILATGWDNPATSQVAFSILRSNAPMLSVMNLHDLSGKHQLSHVVWHDDQRIEFTLANPHHTLRFTFCVESSNLSIEKLH